MLYFSAKLCQALCRRREAFVAGSFVARSIVVAVVGPTLVSPGFAASTAHKCRQFAVSLLLLSELLNTRALRFVRCAVPRGKRVFPLWLVLEFSPPPKKATLKPKSRTMPKKAGAAFFPAASCLPNENDGFSPLRRSCKNGGRLRFSFGNAEARASPLSVSCCRVLRVEVLVGWVWIFGFCFSFFLCACLRACVGDTCWRLLALSSSDRLIAQRRFPCGRSAEAQSTLASK